VRVDSWINEAVAAARAWSPAAADAGDLYASGGRRRAPGHAHFARRIVRAGGGGDAFDTIEEAIALANDSVYGLRRASSPITSNGR
jgi:hypothetical protein